MPLFARRVPGFFGFCKCLSHNHLRILIITETFAGIPLPGRGPSRKWDAKSLTDALM